MNNFKPDHDYNECHHECKIECHEGSKCHCDFSNELKCPKCFFKCHNDWNVCPKCSQRLKVLNCPKCHNQCNQDLQKCNNCNHDFHHDCC